MLLRSAARTTQQWPYAKHTLRCLTTSASTRVTSETRGSAQSSDQTEVDIEYLKTKSYIYRDILIPTPVNLLEAALKSYLPRKSHSNANDLKLMQIGHQHAYARPSITDDMLCNDGTDDKFLPGPEDVWRYRLWAGGSVNLLKKVPLNYFDNQHVTLFEHASDVRLVSQSGKISKVFVTIERLFSPLSEVLHKSETDLSLGLQSSKDFELYKNTAFLTETENICFLRDLPKSLQDGRKIKPPSDPLFSHSTTPKESLLFQFSALTHNAHRIHLDREFARQEYGAKDLVVHGPLTQALMVEFLRNCLESQEGVDSMVFIPTKIDYTNLKPLYVNEPLRLCCKPATDLQRSSKDLAGRWQVWIETGSGLETSCAVKASVQVDKMK